VRQILATVAFLMAITFWPCRGATICPAWLAAGISGIAVAVFCAALRGNSKES